VELLQREGRLDYAEIVERTEKRIDQAETELAGHRENERSLSEALLSVAKVADTIKHDARLEEETIRRQARNLEQIVATTRSQLTAFLHETLEKLEQLSDEIDTSSQPERLEHAETLKASDLAEQLTPSVVRAKWEPSVVRAQWDGVEQIEGSGATVEGLGPEAAGNSHSPEP
jgi:hypothetical protein